MSADVLTTEELAALRGLGRAADSRWVDWAVRVLDPSRETPALCELAGATAPFNTFEMEALVDRAFAELGVHSHESREAGGRALASIRMGQFLAGSVPVEALLPELSDLFRELDELPELYDFYALRWARMDLMAGDPQHYWPNATRENIDGIVAERCRTRLECGWTE